MRKSTQLINSTFAVVLVALYSTFEWKIAFIGSFFWLAIFVVSIAFDYYHITPESKELFLNLGFNFSIIQTPALLLSLIFFEQGILISLIGTSLSICFLIYGKNIRINFFSNPTK
jgi:hypothetical protein